MAPNPRFAVPPPKAGPPLATAAELADLAERAERHTVRLLLALAESALDYWATTAVESDPELRAEVLAVAYACELALA